MNPSSIISLIPSIFQMGQGQSLMGQGAQLAQQGGQVAASSWMMAGVASLQAAEYNNSIENLRMTREMDYLNRQSKSFISQQWADSTNTGFKSTSKSFLQMMHESVSSVEKQVIQNRNTSDQRKQSMMYQGRIAEAEAINKAKSALYDAQIAASGQ